MTPTRSRDSRGRRGVRRRAHRDRRAGAFTRREGDHRERLIGRDPGGRRPRHGGPRRRLTPRGRPHPDDPSGRASCSDGCHPDLRRDSEATLLTPVSPRPGYRGTVALVRSRMRRRMAASAVARLREVREGLVTAEAKPAATVCRRGRHRHSTPVDPADRPRGPRRHSGSEPRYRPGASRRLGVRLAAPDRGNPPDGEGCTRSRADRDPSSRRELLGREGTDGFRLARRGGLPQDAAAVSEDD